MTSLMKVAAIGLVIGATGCSTNDGAKKDPGPEPVTRVKVVNNNWADVNIYAISGAYRMRLGMVVTATAVTFDLPRSLVQRRGSVRLLVDLIGSTRTHLTEPIMLNAGEDIELDVKNHLAVSSVMVSALRGIR